MNVWIATTFWKSGYWKTALWFAQTSKYSILDQNRGKKYSSITLYDLAFTPFSGQVLSSLTPQTFHLPL